MNLAPGDSSGPVCAHQAILLIAFGGPTSAEEIRPFLSCVLQGVRIPPERVEEVVRHYEAVGGRSPLTDMTLRQAKALQRLLAERGRPLSVYVGMRNSTPFFIDTLKRMAADGIDRALGLIMSAQQTEAGWERYKKNIADARKDLGGRAPIIDYCSGWHDHPLLIQTWVEQIQSALNQVERENRSSTPLIFTAHSLPSAMAAQSAYVQQIEEAGRRIVKALQHRRWSIAYQSRSGNPSEPWLEPDIRQVIRDLADAGARQMVVAPVGFVCDHVEVLYDLDIDAKKTAVDLGVRLLRASCPNDHPAFIRMMADVIEHELNERSPVHV